MFVSVDQVVANFGTVDGVQKRSGPEVSVDQVVANFGTPPALDYLAGYSRVSVDQVVANFGTPVQNASYVFGARVSVDQVVANFGTEPPIDGVNHCLVCPSIRLLPTSAPAALQSAMPAENSVRRSGCCQLRHLYKLCFVHIFSPCPSIRLLPTSAPALSFIV